MKSMLGHNTITLLQRGAQTMACHVALGLLAAGALLGSACTHAQMGGNSVLPMTVKVTNDSDLKLTDSVVRIDNPVLLDAINSNKQETLAVVYEGVPVASQKVDLNGDGEADQFLILDDLKPNQSRTYLLQSVGLNTPKFAQRAHAEISVKEGGVWKEGLGSEGKQQMIYEGGDWKAIQHLDLPKEHTDHSFYIRYEGPGWESDLVGYRIYLDWRNATDIFGKKTPKMILDRVGLDGFDSYHAMADWGQDIFKVGESFGIGSFGYWDGSKGNRVAEVGSRHCTILADGPVSSGFTINYKGWKAGDKTVDLKADFSIDAGSRLTRQDLTLSAPLDNLCTGLERIAGGEVIKPAGDAKGWTYVGTWGKQAGEVVDDSLKDLGIALFYNTDDVIEITEDRLNSVMLVLKPTDNTVTYYYAACWAGEPGKVTEAVTTRDGFEAYMKETAARLNTSLKVDIGGSH